MEIAGWAWKLPEPWQNMEPLSRLRAVTTNLARKPFKQSKPLILRSTTLQLHVFVLTGVSLQAKVEFLKLDLSSLRSVRAAAQQYLDSKQPLHILINNAGVMALGTRQLTEDGFEQQFG